MNGNALIVFARFPDRSVKTRLKGVLSEKDRILFYESLLRSTIDRVRDIDDIDVYLCFTPKAKEGYFSQYRLGLFPQSKGDIGLKMCNAFQFVFNNKYLKAILIGTDIPKISQEIIISAFRSLDENDVVFGPARDGGYYLIGQKRSNPGIFRGIEWSSPSTLKQSLGKARGLGLSIGLVKTLSDIDTVKDLITEGLLENN